MYNNEDSKVQSFEETSFEQEDLVFLEKDLTNKELVSILFLLHGRDKSQWILEKLADTSYKNHLFDFAVRHTNWKTQLIEVFVLTKNFTVINKLGIKSSEAREHFRKSARINVGLKLLYQVRSY